MSVSTMFFDQNHVDNVDSLGDLVCGRSAQGTMEFSWSFHSPVFLPGGSGYHDGPDGHAAFHDRHDIENHDVDDFVDSGLCGRCAEEWKAQIKSWKVTKALSTGIRLWPSSSSSQTCLIIIIVIIIITRPWPAFGRQWPSWIVGR